MPLGPGVRLGPYEIIAAIGAGGMGEVYRARDTKLNRDVALKILPAAFSSDPDRLARFHREAQVLASLNHPHIGAIYGFEDSGETHALVLEFVDGPTLADRIAQGPIPIDEALPIAIQIAGALEAAHEQGIIHRDLKPANIKLRADGTVKVLDFGLAKLAEAGGAGQAGGAGVDALSLSPTITSPALMTGVGVLLGTAAYMAPEQARGKAVDKRADIWAFGCVLFEMLTGRRPFAGDDVTDTIASIVKTDPDWTKLPSTTPWHVRQLLGRCLEKDSHERLRDIGDARLDIRPSHHESMSVSAGVPRRRPLRPLVWIAACGGAAVLGSMLTVIYGVDAGAPPPAVRFSFTLPTVAQFSTTDVTGVAISPDGRHIAYSANGRLLLRDVDRFEAVPLATIDGAENPFFSPDGQWIGFYALPTVHGTKFFDQEEMRSTLLLATSFSATPATCAWCPSIRRPQG